MLTRRTSWLATAVVGILLCGFGLGFLPSGLPLLELRRIHAQYESYSVSIVFPMWEANSVYVASPWGPNATFLPVRADAYPVTTADYVTFSLDSAEFDVDDEAPFIGHLLDINLGIEESFVIEADASYTNGLIRTDSVDIDVFGLPDADENGVPDDAGGFNDPFLVPTGGVWVAEVAGPVYSVVASVGSDTVAATDELGYVVTGSDVTIEVPSGAVPGTDGRLIVRTAPLPADIDAYLGDLPMPSGDGVVPIVAVDAHLVDSTGAEVHELDGPIVVRVPILPIPGGFTEEISRIGIPVFYAETDLDPDYNVEVPVSTTSFEQLEVQQTVENNELVFETSSLTTFVPMFHARAPVILDIEPDWGMMEGGTPVTIFGAGYLDEDLTVTFGGMAATDVNVVYQTSELTGTVTCVTPAYGTEDLVDVRVTNPEDDQGYALFAIVEDGFEFGPVFEPGWDGPEDEGEREHERAGGRGGSGGPCYIATAAYGTHLAEELEGLRAFRDKYLLTNAAGTALVKAYYRYGPGLATVIAGNPAAKALTRAMLTGTAAMVRLMLLVPLWMKLAIVSLAVTATAVNRRKRARC